MQSVTLSSTYHYALVRTWLRMEALSQGSPRSECSTLQLMWVMSWRLQLRYLEKVD